MCEIKSVISEPNSTDDLTYSAWINVIQDSRTKNFAWTDYSIEQMSVLLQSVRTLDQLIAPYNENNCVLIIFDRLFTIRSLNDMYSKTVMAHANPLSDLT